MFYMNHYEIAGAGLTSWWPKISYFAKFAGAIGLLLFLSACGSPQSDYNKVIEKQGYIPYQTPLAAAGVGTILNGPPDSLRVATQPEACFPSEDAQRELTGLRWVTETVLPSQYQRLRVGFGLDLFNMLTVGNPLVALNLNYNRAKTVRVEFGGASIEFMDELALYSYYQSEMSDFCQNMLFESPFIVQALRVESMSFEFSERNGGRIRLTPGVIAEMMNIGADVEWDIQNDYSLVIRSPKYIGYQLSRMDAMRPGRVSELAYRVKRNQYDWVSINQVPLPPELDRQRADLILD